MSIDNVGIYPPVSSPSMQSNDDIGAGGAGGVISADINDTVREKVINVAIAVPVDGTVSVYGSDVGGIGGSSGGSSGNGFEIENDDNNDSKMTMFGLLIKRINELGKFMGSCILEDYKRNLFRGFLIGSALAFSKVIGIDGIEKQCCPKHMLQDVAFMTLGVTNVWNAIWCVKYGSDTNKDFIYAVVFYNGLLIYARTKM